MYYQAQKKSNICPGFSFFCFVLKKKIRKEIDVDIDI